MPPKGYVSVALPEGLITAVNDLIGSHPDLGYRNRTEFIIEATRRRIEQVEAHRDIMNLGKE